MLDSIYGLYNFSLFGSNHIFLILLNRTLLIEICRQKKKKKSIGV
jgi:hypothetical protein